MLRKPSVALVCVTSLILVPTTSQAQDTVKQNQAMLYGYSWGQAVYTQSVGNPATGLFLYAYILNKKYWYTISPYKSYFDIGFNSGWLTAANSSTLGGIPKSGFYSGKISGTVRGSSFKDADIILIIRPTITSSGTLNGVNPRDILLISGNPLNYAKLGSILWGTNSAMMDLMQPMGNYSYSQIDTSLVSIDGNNVNVTLDSSAWNLTQFCFSNNDWGFLGRFFMTQSGNCQLRFSQDKKTITGSINIWGKSPGGGGTDGGYYTATMVLNQVQQ
jgi:hypothetical protein